jgi:predicted O-methyltransferase YrrM
MEIIHPLLTQYIATHTSPESTTLAQLNRETHAKVLKPRMLTGHFQGRFLAMIAQMIKPQFILEIGTYTGYSAICLAEGLGENGKLITIEVNEEMEAMIRKYIHLAGLTEKIELIIGDAQYIIPQLTQAFDLVFIDADKVNNATYYDLVFDKVRKGGFILIDNVLWDGKVLTEAQDKKTQAILDFNQKIQRDDRVENILLPIRDGIMLIQKK